METGINYLEEQFDLPKQEAKQYSPLVLAYIGDAIYDLVIRTIIVRQGNTPVRKLHKYASSLVKAEKQSEMIGRLEAKFTEEEFHIYKRGRNAKSYTTAKNASVVDYRRATGFEAVIGYLYLKGEYARIVDLVKMGLASEKEQD